VTRKGNPLRTPFQAIAARSAETFGRSCAVQNDDGLGRLGRWGASVVRGAWRSDAVGLEREDHSEAPDVAPETRAFWLGALEPAVVGAISVIFLSDVVRRALQIFGF
jgi:hypothetical protein